MSVFGPIGGGDTIIGGGDPLIVSGAGFAAAPVVLLNFNDDFAVADDGNDEATVSSAGPRPFSVPVLGVPTANAHIFDMVFPYACTVAAGLSDWSVTGHSNLANATASTVYDVQKNGASIGTITIGAGGNTATPDGAGGSFNGTTDRLSIVCPATPDATHANFTIHGRITRS
jgi:hypothetical protein